MFFFLFAILLGVFFSSNVSGISPTNFSDPSSAATNESFAYDSNFLTSASVFAQGNVSFFNFPTTNPLIQVNVTFSYTSSGFVDDEWRFLWSQDNSTWIVLQNFSTVNTNTNDTFSLVANWTPALFSNLSLRVETRTVGVSDGFLFSLFEVSTSVLEDAQGPLITLQSPSDLFIQNSSQVNFSYVATDVSNITNCSLFIDDVLNLTNTTINSGEQSSFLVDLADGTYSWNIVCVDSSVELFSNSSESRIVGVDLLAPLISLQDPSNASTWSGGSPVQFSYTYSDVSNATCSLYLNNTLNQTQPAWPNILEYFLVYVENQDFLWNVSCTDYFGQQNSSESFLVSVQNNEAPIVETTVTSFITPLLGDSVLVSCNATLTDTTSSQISAASAVLARQGYVGVDDSSVKLSNSSCQLFPINATSREARCLFDLSAQATAGNWSCTINASDSFGEEGMGSAEFIVDTLYAFNLSTPYISYGSSLKAGEISSDVALTVTNVGNTKIDLTVDGFGSFDGDGLAMICDVGNVTLANHRYSLAQSTPFGSMSQLTDDPVLIPFDLIQGNDTFNSTDNIYWKVQLPVPANGTCLGYVTLTATPS